MRIIVSVATLLFLASLTSPIHAASDNEQVQGLVDKLQAITEKARRERAADRWLLTSLEELVERYNWPWRDTLVTEDFSDGNFHQDPAWQVRSGRFWVDGRLGLRSRSTQELSREPAAPQQPARNEDIGKALLGALLQGALNNNRQNAPDPEPQQESRYQPAEIQLPLAIPNVFAAEVELSVHNAPSEEGQVELGIFQAADGNSGYMLVLYTGRRASIELLSRRSGRSSVIDRVDIDDISDGNSHQLQWRRDGNGQIEVLLDDKQLIRARDQSFRYPFKQFSVTNRSGDFAVANVTIYGGK